MLTVRCFGSVSIVNAEDELALRSRKHAGLLLYLCAHPRSVHARANLARLLWGGCGARERHSLSQALYDIKSNVGSILDANALSVRLRRDSIEYEAEGFEKAVEQGEYQAALNLYRGEFAPTLSNLGVETFDRWLEGERDRYRALASFALRSVLREAEATADWDDVCLAALRLIRMNDFDETAHRALMRGLWLKGDGLSALEHFRELCRRRGTEQSGGLTPEIMQLATRIQDDEVGGSSVGSSELIGRSGEFALMREAYDIARAGRATALIVTGEQGIGKTRLLSEFTRYIEGRGALAGRSVAIPSNRNRPFCSALDLMAATGIDLVDARRAARRGDAQTVFLQVKRGFENGLQEICRRRPVALIIDDAEHIDAESAELLASCRVRLERAPILLVAALDSASPRGTPGRSLEASLRRVEMASVVALQPLGAAHIRQILGRSAMRGGDSILSRAVSLAGGNPLYAIEVLRCLGREEGRGQRVDKNAPSSAEPYLDSNRAQRLLELISERVEGLSQPERSLLRHLAVLGEAVDERLLEEIAQVADFYNVLQTLEGKGLVEPAKDRWRLKHGVVRDVIIREFGHTRRAAIHLAAATVLSRRADADPLLLAEHYANGGEREMAYRCAMRAAQNAIAGAPAKCSAAAKLAAIQAVTVQERYRARFLEGLAALEEGRYAKAESVMLSLAYGSDLPARDLPEIKAALTEAKISLCQWENAEHELRKARKALKNTFGGAPEAPAAIRLAALDLRLAHAKADRPRMRSAAGLLGQLLPRAKLESGTEQLAWFLGWVELLKYSLWCESLTAAKDVLTAYAHIYSHLGRQLRVKALSARAILATREGRLDESSTIYNDLTTDLDVHSSHLRASLLNNLAVVKLERGDFVDAAALLDECIRVDETTSAVAPNAVFGIMNRGACAMYRGRNAEAQRYYQRAAAVCKSVKLYGLRDETTACLGLLALEKGSVHVGERYLKTMAVRPVHQRWEEERFKAAWLRAFLMSRTQPREAGEYLAHASEIEAAFDLPSYYKLHFLASLARTAGERPEERRHLLSQDRARRELVHLGFGWFARAATRWWERAEAPSPQQIF